MSSIQTGHFPFAIARCLFAIARFKSVIKTLTLKLRKIHETIESINQLKTQRDFMLSFSTDPQDFTQEWLRSQRRDLRIITDVIGNPEEERGAAFHHQPWAQEAVGRHIFAKVQQRKQELERVLGICLT
ncbi:SWI/SNF-related matrix-associated actin-dependent regulator of chromatin subfamily D member 2 [Myotis davidii]|uniref:SWI/SNF-related matrix-associated actin-dependent regulator of chromatin subfamily D member 2 n=1 Tax=Myotis davidii TaxID=225400 RepID=L5LKF6_MYODS|nr:SWI/SNF-related matrix-associated actin-dependent regulator of chromatin subfamily D member 2 [Myotis davidii]